MNKQRIAQELLRIAKDIMSRDVRLVALIDGDTGRVVRKRGRATEGIGIFDNSGEEYAGGFTADGEVYGSEVGVDDTIILFSGRKSAYKIGESYPDVV